jgi:cytochrome c553
VNLRALLLALLCGGAWAQGHDQRLQQQCLVCHGPQGRSEQALTPSLAGQPSFYAITQLFLFREGRRDNAAMTAVAKGMSDADLRGFADAIAKLPPPAPPTEAADPVRWARGAALAQKGHCAGCHGADFAGGQQVPRLAHQREDYLRVALQGFRAATRLGYTPAMNEALAGLTPENLDDLAHYLAHLPAR